MSSGTWGESPQKAPPAEVDCTAFCLSENHSAHKCARLLALQPAAGGGLAACAASGIVGVVRSERLVIFASNDEADLEAARAELDETFERLGVEEVEIKRVGGPES